MDTEPDRTTLRGAGVSPGVGAGPVARPAGAVPAPGPGEAPLGEPGVERSRAVSALEAVAADLEERGARAGGDATAVLSAQALMARDPGLAAETGRRVDSGTAAPRAVWESFAAYREVLAGAGEYMAGRVADLDDVRDRAVARLMGIPEPKAPARSEPYVLVARDLAPADTAVLDPASVRAFVTEEGGPTSHTAILARSMGVPAVVACPGAAGLADGTAVLVDGGSGEVRIDPPEADVRAATEAAVARTRAATGGEGPGATTDGHPVPLLANIGRPGDLDAALSAGAEGIGLYRTEFLFLDRAEPPGAAEQVEAYQKILAAFPGGRVVVRVLDAGADKPLSFLPPSPGEPNPALGERGLRLLRRHPDVLAGQLRALHRAATETPAGARLEVMAPMVADVADAEWFAAACREAGITGGIGAMIEVPAAALRAGDIAGAVDFFSIGSNDLAQYAFAADRQVGAVGRLQDPWQPALLDLLAQSAAAAARAGAGCGVCGEAAADPVLACVLAGLGVTSLSMGPPAIPLVRAALAAHSLATCEAAANAARRARTADGARAAARAELDGLTGLGL